MSYWFNIWSFIIHFRICFQVIFRCYSCNRLQILDMDVHIYIRYISQNIQFFQIKLKLTFYITLNSWKLLKNILKYSIKKLNCNVYQMFDDMNRIILQHPFISRLVEWNVFVLLFKIKIFQSFFSPIFCSFLLIYAGSGVSSGKILQRFPEVDWEDCPYTQGVEWVSYFLFFKKILFCINRIIIRIEHSVHKTSS